MIKSLRLRNFKNFEDTTFRFGPFSVIAGENATGKSNLGDALRFLHGIGRGFDLARILKGIERPTRSGADEVAISAEFLMHDEHTLRYDIVFSATPSKEGGPRIVSEDLTTDETILTRTPPLRTQGTEGANSTNTLYVRRKSGRLERIDNISEISPVLTTAMHIPDVQDSARGYIIELLLMLLRTQCLVLNPEALRAPGIAGGTFLHESGRGLPSALQRVCVEKEKNASVVEWLRELTPTDISDLRFFEDPDGRVHLEVREREGGRFGAHSVSDGTLRFMAMLTVVLDSEEATTYFLDEFENGLHPSRIGLLLRLIEQHVDRTGLQIIATTHAPEVLDRMNDRTFEDSMVLARVRGRSSSSAHRLADLPDAERLRTSRGLGRLLRNGWMEDVLYLEDDTDSESGDYREKVTK